MKEIERLASGERLSLEEWRAIIADEESYPTAVLGEMAVSVRDAIYGRRVFIRGLIEFTSYCRNDCYYCGIRRSNGRAERYRMTPEAILDTCALGYARGFRTFVLQGGEDPYWTDDILSPLIMRIKESCPEAAVTLSLGERSDESYQRLREAGADRYLLRHETADSVHYGRLHPSSMSLDNRKRCLRTLKRLGYQTGAGMMIGSPFSSVDTLAADMAFLQELSPEMVGMGPFIPHHDTPFRDERRGSVALTLRMISLVRLALPHALIPATTALGTIAEDGREKGILAGANVVMPNLSPPHVRENYLLYDNKLCTGSEAAESLQSLEQRMEAIGYRIAVSRGDSLNLHL